MVPNKQKKEIVKFIRERTFGDLIGAPFEFIIQEFKSFAGTLLKYAGPFVAVTFLMVSLLANDIFNAAVMKSNTPTSTIIYAVILIFSLMFGMLAVVIVTHSYISLYVSKGKGNFTKDDVGELLKKNLWKVFGAGILVYIMVVIGFLLFYIPGIYLAVATIFIFLIIIYENKSATESISRSFEIIKGKWWQTFGLILVFGLIIGSMSYIFIIPIYAVVIVAFLSGTQIAAGSVILLSLFIFLYFTAYLFFMSMQQIMIAFQYFNIRDGKEGLHIKDRIAAINDEKSSEREGNDEILKNDNNKTKEKKESQKNRFEENDDIDRFKPKY